MVEMVRRVLGAERCKNLVAVHRLLRERGVWGVDAPQTFLRLYLRCNEFQFYYFEKKTLPYIHQTGSLAICHSMSAVEDVDPNACAALVCRLTELWVGETMGFDDALALCKAQ